MSEKVIYTAAVITVSDKCSARLREDVSGQAIIDALKERGYEILSYTVVPDERNQISDAIRAACQLRAHLVLTTGGTGFSKRDVTPEATRDVIEREAPGISEAIRWYSLAVTPRAMLGRGVSGLKDDSIIINMPGSPKAVKESMSFIMDSLKHGIDILNGFDSECARKD